jgi:hypothetical protein
MKPLSLVSILAFTALALSLQVSAQDDSVATPQSVTIPLQTILLPGGTYRLGISARIGGAPVAEPYLLDTGSFGFFSAWTSTASWWNGTYANTTDSGTASYTGGIEYYFNTVITNVTLGSNPAATAQNVHVGLITNVTLNGVVDTAFYAALAKGHAPEGGGHFYGTLGSGLGSIKDAGGLYAIAAQLPGNLGTGFIIHTGGPGGRATLTVGLTPALRKQFTVLIPMQGANTTVTFPNSGYPTYTLQLGVVLDSGDPNGVIYNKDAFELPDSFVTKGMLTKGETMTLAASAIHPVIDPLPADLPFIADPSGLPQDWSWTITTGNLTGINQINLSPKPPAGEAAINTGITPFMSQDIMFDIQNGLVGFKKITESAYTQIAADPVTTPTASSKVTITGVARSSDKILSVLYKLGNDAYKKASGTESWKFTTPLKTGINTITVRAISSRGLATTQTLSITRS